MSNYSFIPPANTNLEYILDLIKNDDYETLIALPLNYNHLLNELIVNSCRYTSLRIFKYLVDLGADVHYKSNYVFLFSTIYHNYPVFEYLFSGKFEISAEELERAIINTSKDPQLKFIMYIIEKFNIPPDICLQYCGANREVLTRYFKLKALDSRK